MLNVNGQTQQQDLIDHSLKLVLPNEKDVRLNGSVPSVEELPQTAEAQAAIESQKRHERAGNELRQV